MKKGLVLFLLLIYFVSNVVIISNAQERLKLYAQASIMIEKESGRVLYADNAFEQRAMASTTKIMTAIVALENGDLEDKVKVSKKAAQAPPVKLSIKEGEEYRLMDLLYALMLESSNDVAVAIAEHVGGSVDEFCRMMTMKAEEIGAVSTCYKTPNGLDAEGHYSTAYDLALIARYALKNDKFVEIINTPNWQFSKENGNSRNLSVTNKNAFLSGYAGAYGIKTGYTGKAGYCFVGVASRNGMDIISVVLGSSWPPHRTRKWVDTRKLMDYGFKTFKMVKILEEDTPLEPIKVIKGKEPEVGCYIDGALLLPLSKEDKVKIKYKVVEEIESPVGEQDVLGIAKIYINDELYDNYFIRASKSIEREDFKYNFQKLFNHWIRLEFISLSS